MMVVVVKMLMYYCKTLLFRRILISRFAYVENLLHFILADFPVIKQFIFCFFWCFYQLLFGISYHIIVYYLEYCTAYWEVLLFYANQLMVTGSSKNSRVFNFAILLKSRKSRKFDAREIYIFYSILLIMSCVFRTLHIRRHEIVYANATAEPPVVTPPSTPLHPTPVWPTPGGITEEEARRICERPILSSSVYASCQNFTTEVMQTITKSCMLDLQVNCAQL